MPIPLRFLKSGQRQLYLPWHGLLKSIHHKEQGSLSLEAAIALPVFFCVIVAIVFLLRCVEVHERMQHAISQSAIEISGMAYAYAKLGALDIQREAESAVERSTKKVADTIRKSSQFENWLPEEASDEVNDQFEKADEALSDIFNSALFSGLASSMTEKYIAPLTENAEYTSKTTGDSLSGLNIEGGGLGLSYDGSTFLSKGTEDVNVTVSYRYKIPIFIEPLSRIGVTQRAKTKAWLFGAGRRNSSQGDDAILMEEDIWSLPSMERGVKLQKIYHANLPHNFPTITSYSNGTITGVHSLDTTSVTYSTPSGVSRKINSYVKELAAYNGQEKPWGAEKIVIHKKDIKNRRLVLVIPRNEAAPEIKEAINKCIRDAAAKGVAIQVEYYGKKQIDKSQKTTNNAG